ncbi:hypothetical protein [Siphonobacter curvatus]|uniref:Uncharacterized protein n=1 Tax=Siphonobacter curvatus TaxID=2094562 RepID=A0A2S7IJK2_9BACT|nr:hypothetical protein [Siphonobacter curvatus]PQA56367.1 hypothetical protein C5O19_18695 [Siphonobacter curvatus]
MTDFPLFKSLFNDVWQELTNACQQHLKGLDQARNLPNLSMQEKFDSIQEACRRQLASLSTQTIELTHHSLGSYNKTYEVYLNEYRTFITREFLTLGDTLNQGLAQAKQGIFDRMQQEGRLKGVSEKDLPFEESLLREMAILPDLEMPLRWFKEFHVSYLGSLHFKIREHLDILKPDFIFIHLSRDASAQDILLYITNSVEDCLDRIQEEYEAWAKDLNKMSFALVEEVLDQLFRAKNARDHWEIFYYRHRTMIWPETYQGWSSKQEALKQGQAQLEQLKHFLS